MRKDRQEKRRKEIEQAAYDLLAEKGYGGASMLSVAKKAKASNETLYNWYGDKQGLFLSLVAQNLVSIKSTLEMAGQEEKPPQEQLQMLGPKLLTLLVGQRAITLNRAAAADASGELGAALAKGGRETVFPMIEAIFTQLSAEIERPSWSPAEATEVYIGLLVGDLQIRRAIGVLKDLNPTEIETRALRAYNAILKLIAQ